jgi:arylsulfatase A-like enzyme
VNFTAFDSRFHTWMALRSSWDSMARNSSLSRLARSDSERAARSLDSSRSRSASSLRWSVTSMAVTMRSPETLSSPGSWCMDTCHSRWTARSQPSSPHSATLASRYTSCWSDRRERWLADGHTCWAFFDNDLDGYAVEDAQRLEGLLGRRPAGHSLLMMMLWLWACRGEPGSCDSDVPREAPRGDGGNVLVLLMDDVGVDQVSAYDMHPDPVPMPALEALAAQGVRFDRAYTSSSCSPTRASLLTGRHPSRTGVGWWLMPEATVRGLPDDELTLPEMLRETHASALVGKWHLSPFDASRSTELDPLRQGFDHFVGLLGNLDSALTRRYGEPGQPDLGYYYWERIADGEIAYNQDWITTVQTDDALDLLGELPEPWLQVVSYSAAHEPWTYPPEPWPAESALRSTIRDLDAQMGRLLEQVDLQSTTVIVLSDNGTPSEGILPPWNRGRAKLTLFDGGVRVPMIVAGRGVTAPGTVSDALVHVTDVFATVADLAGVDVETLDRPIDGLSLRPWMEGGREEGRRCLMVEHFRADGFQERAVLDREHELLRADAGWRLYALGHSPGDQGSGDLLREPTEASREAERRLRHELRRYDRTVPRP